ncbi:PepSY-associated TM helix domain-containing protein [Sandaracinus amylolyticus]|uniref:Putative iron-regulated membrane protein n=1 Tax=Sandaracinus amylolyticus TaxID=927083 RepID=A0A0F6SH64_9BACT|nr:PepSY-associated TM helix domain-containing protein [Sandaracinus amylolyticus]AKF09899.1 putative iron-regulated membrane protein [Sandaracinus amylolyticus]
MKLPRHAFQTYWDVHAWSGAIAAIVLSAMFFAGVFALFHEEIALWQETRAHHAPGTTCRDASLEPLVARALEDAPFAARNAFVTLHEGACAPITIDLRGAEAQQRRIVIGDVRSGEVLDERSNVATFLFYFHFLYHPDVAWGMYVAGLLGLVLLLAIVSGVLIHLKDLARQLHRYRDDAHGVRVLFSDLHKVLGVMGLPFQTMVALTGTIICFAAPLARAWQGPVFANDPNAALYTFFDIDRAPPPSDVAGPRLPIDELVARARAALPEMEAESVRIVSPGDASSSIEVRGPVHGVLFGQARVRVRASDGEVLRVSVLDRARATHVLMRWVYGLHYAYAGGAVTRLLYALLGIAGCATLLSGNWIWLARRDRKREHRGNRVLARLTLGVGLGIANAVAAMFLASRVLPMSLAWHVEGEVAAFVLVWIAVTIAAFVARDEARCAIATLVAAGATFLLVPIVSIAVTPLHLLAAPTSVVAAVDVGLAACGALLLGCAALVRRGARRAR